MATTSAYIEFTAPDRTSKVLVRASSILSVTKLEAHPDFHQITMSSFSDPIRVNVSETWSEIKSLMDGAGCYLVTEKSVGA